MRVQVVYAEIGAVDLSSVELAAGSTIGDAIGASGLLLRHPEIASSTLAVGIFGAVKSCDEPLRDGDRVEVYRRLRADPKEARRLRAKSRY